MKDPTQIQIRSFNDVLCPAIDQITTVEMCENCKHSGEVTEDIVECYYEPDKP